MTTIYLVRHAPTAETGKKLTGWTTDVHLSDDGLQQAEAVAEAFRDAVFDAIYSSPIDRSMETARSIAARHPGLRVTTSRALGEVQFGKWTNRSLKALARTKLWDQVQRTPSAVRFPDGESPWEVQTRAVREMERLKDEHPNGTVCCVSHGDVIKLIAAHYLGMHIDLYQRLVIAPSSVTIIAIGGSDPRVVRVNAPIGSLRLEGGS